MGSNFIKIDQQQFLTKEEIHLCRLMMNGEIQVAVVKQERINKCMLQA
jgi:hypothetical protein